MAGDLALGGYGGEGWGERLADGLRIRTARVEGTAAGDVKPVRDLADNGQRPGRGAPRRCGRGDQGGSIWMPGLTADGFSAANLDQFAQVHDAQPVTHMLDCGQIVADQEIGDADLSLQI